MDDLQRRCAAHNEWMRAHPDVVAFAEAWADRNLDELHRAAVLASSGTVNLSNPRAIFAGSPPRFTRSRVTYEAYVVSRTSTRPQVDSAGRREERPWLRLRYALFGERPYTGARTMQ